jgi:Bax protein
MLDVAAENDATMKKTNFQNILLSIPFAALMVFSSPLLKGCEETNISRAATPSPEIEVEIISPETHADLKKAFRERQYNWDSLDKGVPPLILRSLPEDLDRIGRVTEKKRIFFLAMLPMVLLANEEIEQQRRYVIDLFETYDAGRPMPPAHLQIIEKLMKDYRLPASPLNNPRSREMLLERLDVIPPSLALAQAATESAYGTSRFARQGNNLFGQWTFVKGAGLVPRDRPAGMSHEVRRFENLFESVRSYIRNINTHWAYQSLRERRANMRKAGLPLMGKDLARGLLNYSERREAYVAEIRAIIRRNHLAILSDATLRPALEQERSIAKAPDGAGLLATTEMRSRSGALRLDP